MTTAYPTALDVVTADAFVAVANVRSGKVATQSNSGATGAAALKCDFDPVAEGYPSTGLLSVQPDDNSAKPVIVRYSAISSSGGSPGSFTIAARGVDTTTDRNLLVGERVGLAVVAVHHNDHSGAIIALEAKLGIGASTPVANSVYTGTGTGTSAWTDILNPTANTLPLKASGYDLDDSALKQTSVKLYMDDNHRFEVTRVKSAFDTVGYGQEAVVGYFTYNPAYNAGHTYNTYQGAAGSFASSFGAGGVNSVGTLHGLNATITAVSSGDPGNEIAAMYLAVDAQDNIRVWGMDGKFFGPSAVQTNLLTGIVNMVSNHNSGTITNGSASMVVGTLPYVAGGSSSRNTSYKLDVLLAIVGFTGSYTTPPTQATCGPAATYGLKVGGWASGWMYDSTNRFSKFSNAAYFTDYTGEGVRIGPGYSGSLPLVILTESEPLYVYEVNSSGSQVAAMRMVFDANVMRFDQGTGTNGAFTSYRGPFGFGSGGDVSLGGVAGVLDTPSLVAKYNNAGVIIGGGGTTITQSGYKLQVDGQTHLRSDSQPQLRITKADNLRPITFAHDGNNLTLTKTNGSIGSGNYGSLIITPIGEVDANNSPYNGVVFGGHGVTESGNARRPDLSLFSRSATATNPTDFEFLFSTGGAAIGTVPAALSFGATNFAGTFIRFGFGSGAANAPQALRIDYVDGTNASGEFRGNFAIKNGATTKITLTKDGHIESSSTLGSVTAGTGAGSSPSVFTVSGSDTAGIITLTAGSAPTANANIVTVNYGVAYGAKPVVIITPASDLAGQHAARVYVDDANCTSGLFILKNCSSALTASGAYRWYYQVIR